MKNYRKRVMDGVLDRKMAMCSAVSVTGTVLSGKSTTCARHAKTVTDFHKMEENSTILYTARVMPEYVMNGRYPVMFDGWEKAPEVFSEAERNTGMKPGRYIFCGNLSRYLGSNEENKETIPAVTMYPMSLFESGESDGKISLGLLFDSPADYSGATSDTSMDRLIQAVCRGGWPESVVSVPEKKQALFARDIYEEICTARISYPDGVKRDPAKARAAMRALSSAVMGNMSRKNMAKNIAEETQISRITAESYIAALKDICVVYDVPAWQPPILSPTSLRRKNMVCLADPSLAVSAMNMQAKYFRTDMKAMSGLFKCLCMRDMKVYSSAFDGTVSYFSDRFGTVCDCVMERSDGKYALMDFRLGESETEDAAKDLNKIENMIYAHNKKNPDNAVREPDLKIILTASQYGYRRKDNVMVIPVGCIGP